MRNYDVILFDLDGTLIDSRNGILKSAQFALSQFDIYEENLDQLAHFLGPPLHLTFQRYFPAEEKKVLQAAELYREYYSKYAMSSNVVFPGIPELVKELKQRKKKLIVATIKLKAVAVQSLMHVNLHQHFDMVIGSNPDGSLTSKTEIVQRIYGCLPKYKTWRAVMVGDCTSDIFAAHENTIDSVAVTYGSDSAEELQKSNPTYLVHSVNELAPILLYS